MSATIHDFPPLPKTIGSSATKALGKLGGEMIADAERLVSQHVYNGQKIVGQIEEKLAEIDEARNDFEREKLVRELNILRTLHANHLTEAVHQMNEAAKLRTQAKKEPSFLHSVYEALASTPQGAA